MFSVLDILFLVLIVLFAIRGFIRGFVASILKSARFFLAVILAIVLTAPVAGLINDHVIHPPVYRFVNNKIESLADRAEGNGVALYENLPGLMKNQLDVESEDLAGSLDGYVTEWSETISQKISGGISGVIAVVTLFIVFMLLLSLVIKLVAGLIHAGPLATLDRLLGLGLGLVVGVAVVMLLAGFVSPILIAIGQEGMVESSFVLDLLG